MRIKRILENCSPPETQSGIDLQLLEPLILKYNNKKGSLIPLLQGIQELYNYIPKEAIQKLSAETTYKLSDIYGVVTFYAQFRLTPVGKYIIKVCHGTACHVQNAVEVTNALQDFLNIKDGETTPDGLFTLESVACLGCCSLAPVLMIGENTYGKLTAKSAVKIIRTLKNS